MGEADNVLLGDPIGCRDGGVTLLLEGVVGEEVEEEVEEEEDAEVYCSGYCSGCSCRAGLDFPSYKLFISGGDMVRGK